MELIYRPIINIRTLLIWENITGKNISDMSDIEDDVFDMKYASVISGGALLPKTSFNMLYGSNGFKKNFDDEFLYSLWYFKSYGKHLFDEYAVTELISLLQEKYKIDYETIVGKMTFQEIERLIQ